MSKDDDARDAALRYVRDRLAEGRTADEILDALKIGGWSAQDARAALLQAGAAIPAAPSGPRPRSAAVAVAVAGGVIAVILAFTITMRASPGLRRSVASIGRGGEEVCMSNVKQISLAMMMYTQDFDGRYPDASQWHVATQLYMRNVRLLTCPRDRMPKPLPGLAWEQGGGLSYAFQSDLSGQALAQIARPAETPVLFDSDLVPAATWQQAACRHQGGKYATVGFADGHVVDSSPALTSYVTQPLGGPPTYGPPPSPAQVSPPPSAARPGAAHPGPAPPPGPARAPAPAKVAGPTNRGAVAPLNFETAFPHIRGLDCTRSVQSMASWADPGRWVGGAQQFVAAKKGSSLAYTLRPPRAGRCRLDLYATRAPDYATLRITLDGRRLGEDVDLYGRDVAPTGRIALGAADLTAVQHVIRFEVVGHNPASKGYSFGLDCLDLRPSRPGSQGR
jgi:prepilin-type processing-associated H-X9-DG protein